MVLTEVHPTKAALDEAMASGSLDGLREQFDQLEEFVQQPWSKRRGEHHASSATASDAW